MATPDQVRRALRVVTGASLADLRSVTSAALGTGSPSEIRAALFAASPLIVGDYIDGSAALALDWYEELRDAASPRHRFQPTPLTVVDDDALMASVAATTEPLYELEQSATRPTLQALDEATTRSLRLLEPVIQRSVADGFRTTVVGNTRRDPDAVGWRRYASGGACKFCVMLADRGAVYTEESADFAAHGTCHCTCGPSYDANAPRANVMQYVASSKNRTPEQQAALRDYLNTNYPDSPG